MARGEPEASRRDQCFGALHRLLPTRLLSAVTRRVAASRSPALRRPLNRFFIHRFGLDLTEAEHAEPDAYPSFNALFTRALRPGARPLPEHPSDVASPCDGRISAFGSLDRDTVLQAKHHGYSVDRLLGPAQPAGNPFRAGAFINVYLSPRDYHRVHLPLNGWLQAEAHMPGRLLTVAPAAVRSVRELFLRNERLVTVWQTAFGPMAVVLVGAVNVGGIEAVWRGPLQPRGLGDAEVRHYREETSPVRGALGDEIGRFNLGSTVIVLFPRGTVAWASHLLPAGPVRMGEPIGRLRGGPA